MPIAYSGLANSLRCSSPRCRLNRTDRPSRGWIKIGATHPLARTAMSAACAWQDRMVIDAV